MIASPKIHEKNLYTAMTDEDDEKSYFSNQNNINDLIRDLDLTKENEEILTSLLKHWNYLLPDNVWVTHQRKRQHLFSTYFTLIESACCCLGIIGLFEAVNIPCTVTHWHLFIDSSQRSPKVILLHNKNVHPSLPTTHSIILKERYENEKKLMDLIKYENAG